MNKQKQDKINGNNSFIRYSSLGFEMMAIIGIFTFAGYKLDQWLDNEFKGFTFGLMVLSVIIALIYGTKNLLKRNNKSQKTNRK